MFVWIKVVVLGKSLELILFCVMTVS